jgi:Ran GTPase-activating protein (RanGAP) involved in mRNA processing and transport
MGEFLIFKTNTKIKEINLKYNGFSLEGTIPFAECLKLNKTLIKIDLSCNRMSLDCANTLSNALHQNSTLEYLNVLRMLSYIYLTIF